MFLELYDGIFFPLDITVIVIVRGLTSTRNMNKIHSINGVNSHLISWFCEIGFGPNPNFKMVELTLILRDMH